MKQKKKKETKDADGFIEIPFGAFDSETIGWTYTIPEDFTAKIEDGKIIVEKKESDDEWIRKHIIKILDNLAPCHWDGNEKARCIAYLETQKEQKPTVNIDNFKSFMMQYLQDAANRKTDSEIESDTDKWAKKLLNLIEVKEQKPAEWSEEDETYLEYALWCVMKTRCFVAKDACDLDACQCAERWLESLPERFNLQSKQEWSEEDKKMRDAILQDLANIKAAYPKVNIQEEFDWLKSLRPRPHWRPSEEQMDAIQYVSNFDYGGHRKALESLYNDLKKL